MTNIFPIILIVLMVGAGAVDIYNGFGWRSVYWGCAAMLNVAIINMSKP